MQIEFAILDWFQSIHCAPLDALSVFFDAAGAHGELWIALAAVLLALPKTRKAGLAAAFGLLFYLVVGHFGLKPLFARPRPCDVSTAFIMLVERPHGWSFPSGHTTSAFAAATAILFVKNRLGRSAVALSAVIALTRLYLYVHYPTDVLAGAAIGTALGFAGAKCAAALMTHLPQKAAKE